jgi:hypothetical protein
MTEISLSGALNAKNLAVLRRIPHSVSSAGNDMQPSRKPIYIPV